MLRRRHAQVGARRGRALDVFPDEPAAKGDRFTSPLQGLANVLLTPHVGGSTEEAQEAIAEDVCDKLIKFVNVGSTGGAVNVPEVELPEQIIRDGTRTAPHRILHFHKNVPGVLSKMHSLIAQMNANISAEYFRTSDDVGYVVLDVDPSDAEAIRRKLADIPRPSAFACSGSRQFGPGQTRRDFSRRRAALRIRSQTALERSARRDTSALACTPANRPEAPAAEPRPQAQLRLDRAEPQPPLAPRRAVPASSSIACSVRGSIAETGSSAKQKLCPLA